MRPSRDTVRFEAGAGISSRESSLVGGYRHVAIALGWRVSDANALLEDRGGDLGLGVNGRGFDIEVLSKDVGTTLGVDTNEGLKVGKSCRKSTWTILYKFLVGCSW